MSQESNDAELNSEQTFQTESEKEQPVSEYEAAGEVQEQTAEGSQDAASQQPAMSPEHMLLLQVLRRAKRQQDLIMQVQKSLKTLSNVEKQVARTTDQVRQLQSAAKETQRQIMQTQKQIAAVEKRIQKMAASGRKVATMKRSSAGKNKANKKRGSKNR